MNVYNIDVRTVGLINSKFKYLSAETFGFRINANGKALMKKQVRKVAVRGSNPALIEINLL